MLFNFKVLEAREAYRSVEAESEEEAKAKLYAEGVLKVLSVRRLYEKTLTTQTETKASGN